MAGLLAQKTCSHQRLGRNRDIGGAGRDHKNLPFSLLLRRLLLDCQTPRLAMIGGCRKRRHYLMRLVCGKPWHEDITPFARHGRHDALNLLDTLPLTKDHLRQPLTKLTMMIHLGAAQILERKLAQLCQRFFNRDISPLERLQQTFKIIRGHRCNSSPPAKMNTDFIHHVRHCCHSKVAGAECSRIKFLFTGLHRCRILLHNHHYCALKEGINMGKTTAEKIFEAHLVNEPFPGTKVLRLDVVLCHEITTPIAIDDLIRRGKDRVFDTTRIKAVIDHVTPSKDSKTATQAKILRDWARRHAIKDFFDVGANGVCHALFPEKGFIRPGYTVIMGDSHTCTHGAFGAFAAGIGTTDLEVGILKGVCAFRQPKTIKFNVTGTLPKGVYAKDVILHIIGKIGVNGATDRVMEFHGSTIDTMTMESRMTLCNMAIEAGGTSGICQPDMTTVDYLWPFINGDFASKEAALADYSQWRADSDAEYDKTIEIDVATLEPTITFGYKPDQVKTVSEMAGTPLDQIYIGSCSRSEEH